MSVVLLARGGLGLGCVARLRLACAGVDGLRGVAGVGGVWAGAGGCLWVGRGVCGAGVGGAGLVGWPGLPLRLGVSVWRWERMCVMGMCEMEMCEMESGG